MRVVVHTINSIQDSVLACLREESDVADSSNEDNLYEQGTTQQNNNKRVRTEPFADEGLLMAQASEGQKRLKQTCAHRSRPRLSVQNSGSGMAKSVSSPNCNSSVAFPSTQEELIDRGIRRLEEELAVLNATEGTLLSLYGYLRREESLLLQAVPHASEAPLETIEGTMEQQRVEAHNREERAFFFFADEIDSEGDDESVPKETAECEEPELVSESVINSEVMLPIAAIVSYIVPEKSNNFNV